ncbi:hypothetical protein [Halobellus sp. H-GB7]|uniref:hypothetical protein n=1 Tax=Halobellus sp. H-GB7 TaxID=3069756 RepID=UPI0027B2CFF1|nr:hypothetical protein [Halobellus sp. H-GB7]MDQ2055547.1 hypothetical protein [Halobellus sp. H-GB7]
MSKASASGLDPEVLHNLWAALKHELPYHLGDPAGFRLTGLETLHALREADFKPGKRGKIC